MLLGYMRASPQDPESAIQKAALQQAGCTKICQDSLQATPLAAPGLELAMKLLQKEDTLFVLTLECLGYGVKPLVGFIEKLGRQGIHFKSLADGLDSAAQGEQSFFRLIKRLGQLERGLFLEELEKGKLLIKAKSCESILG